MSTEVTDNTTDGRFEIAVDGERAGIAEYRRVDKVIHFTHTEVGDEWGGRGLARQLVEAALDASRTAGETVEPHCPYVRKVIADAPDRWLDLVAPDRRAAFDLPA